eukprot:TRINITY_DN25419_c0_g1_i2.p1 TRINITY_DN25419_c0_g1~~TRINITY_DN25419_c0_g1_i2.p1  ORF type:complete len:411 (-),score=102.34 TRINITY_DN25419_c0_g1_i2:37-1269(-)
MESLIVQGWLSNWMSAGMYLSTTSTGRKDGDEEKEEGQHAAADGSAGYLSKKSIPALLAGAPTADTLPEMPLGRAESDASSLSVAGSGSSRADQRSSGDDCDLEAVIIRGASRVKPWNPLSFQVIETLQTAARNQGRVEKMKAADSGRLVAVKRMPISWTRSGHQEFIETRGAETELPWIDVGVARFLADRDFQFVCEPLGVFQNTTETFVVSSLATEGDLFGWCQEGAAPGPTREDIIRPLVKQIIAAVSGMHDLGIAHMDLSLENVLLTKGQDEELQVKLIDFGMSALGKKRLTAARGKPSYQAPEMHREAHYDPMRADVFSLGVVLYSMGTTDYPWMSTRPNACKCFEFVWNNCFRAYLAKRKTRNSTERLSETLSLQLINLLEELLMTDPSRRPALGQHPTDWLIY